MIQRKIGIIVYGTILKTEIEFKEKLERNFTLHFCHNFNQIQNVIQMENIKLALLEIGINGKELKILKKLHEQYPKIKIIAIGEEEPIDNLIKAFKYGINDFYKLPLNINLLIERINNIVSKNDILYKAI